MANRVRREDLQGCFQISGPPLAVATAVENSTAGYFSGGTYFTAQLGRGDRWALIAAGPSEIEAVEKLCELIAIRFPGVSCRVQHFGVVKLDTAPKRIMAFHILPGCGVMASLELAALLEAVADDIPPMGEGPKFSEPTDYGSPRHAGLIFRMARAARRMGGTLSTAQRS